MCASLWTEVPPLSAGWTEENGPPVSVEFHLTHTSVSGVCLSKLCYSIAARHQL